MKPVVFHHRADAEVSDAATYYEIRSPGLGLGFLAELERAVGLVATHPEAAPLVSDEIRRYPLRRFPYSLLYAVEPDRLRIVAVAHQKRRPNYWRARV